MAQRAHTLRTEQLHGRLEPAFPGSRRHRHPLP
jgi:hypothetical protein